MPKPATFIALPMSINPRKWYLVYLVMLIYFKIVMLSVTLQQSVTMYKLLRFRLLCQKVMLLVFLVKKLDFIVLQKRIVIFFKPMHRFCIGFFVSLHHQK